MRTFQQIYDFCLLDVTWNVYNNVPDHFKCKTKREYQYYYGNINNRNQSRVGTYYYCQAQTQFKRYIKNQQQDFYIHINPETFEQVDYQKFSGRTIYIVAHIKRKGVQIEFTHPFKHPFESDRVWFTARSHHSFDAQGLIEEVKNHIDKKLLYPPGRYRDLQTKHCIPKERFIEWYNDHKRKIELQNEQEYWEMIEAYSPTTDSISDDDAYDILNQAGVFYDLGCDSLLEKEDLARQFADMYNR